MEQCRLFQLHVDFPAIVTDCGGNIAKAFNSTLEWDWLRCGCHLIHNVVKARLDSLKNHALNPAQTMVATLQEALDRSVVLSFHCIFAQMICMLCQKNMCAMWYIPASRDVRWSKFVGTGKERNAFFPVSFPFLFFPAHFRAHLYCQLQTVVARSILIGFKRFKILQTHKEESYP